MTRARDRLYVCGTRKQSTDTATGWHALVESALAPASRVTETEEGAVELEWRPPPVRAVAGSDVGIRPDIDEPLPGWAVSLAAPAATPAARVAPSTVLRLGEESEIAVGPPTGRTPAEAGGALLRGTLIHRLLESLPDHPADKRRAVGTAYLAAMAPEVDSAAMLDEVTAILDEPRFAPLFAAGSRAEVDIGGRVTLHGGIAEVSGRIDRLAVTESQVFIVDYKTNRPPPRRIEDVPDDYVAQLAIYRQVLAGLYPNRPVVAALLWTDIPLLMEIPSRLLDKALST
jgi:ATP-dependent helicase/nuclease subunit A